MLFDVAKVIHFTEFLFTRFPDFIIDDDLKKMSRVICIRFSVGLESLIVSERVIIAGDEHLETDSVTYRSFKEKGRIQDHS